MKTQSNPAAQPVAAHLATLSSAALYDWAAGRIDEVMTDALYAAVGATCRDDMTVACEQAKEQARAALAAAKQP